MVVNTAGQVTCNEFHIEADLAAASIDRLIGSLDWIDPAGRLRTSSGPQFEDPRVVAFGCDQQRHAIRRKADRFALVQQTALVRRRQTDQGRPFPHCGSPGISGHATEQVSVLVSQHPSLQPSGERSSAVGWE